MIDHIDFTANGNLNSIMARPDDADDVDEIQFSESLMDMKFQSESQTIQKQPCNIYEQIAKSKERSVILADNLYTKPSQDEALQNNDSLRISAQETPIASLAQSNLSSLMQFDDDAEQNENVQVEQVDEDDLEADGDLYTGNCPIIYDSNSSYKERTLSRTDTER